MLSIFFSASNEEEYNAVLQAALKTLGEGRISPPVPFHKGYDEFAHVRIFRIVSDLCHILDETKLLAFELALVSNPHFNRSTMKVGLHPIKLLSA